MRLPRTPTAALLGLVASAALVLAGPAAPASAADLGTLTVTPTTGPVGSGVADATPMLTAVTTSAACPTGYGTNAVAKVGPVGGPYSNLDRIGSDNNYDAGPFTLGSNRSMAKALGAVPRNGDYEVVVQCSGEILGDNPGYFRVGITVAAGTWTVRAGGPAPGPSGSAPAGTRGSMTLNASVAPSPGAAGPSASPPGASAAPSPGPGGSGSGGGSLPRTGVAIVAIVALGALLTAGGVLLRRMGRRHAAFVGDDLAG
ncbi:hypothetical protein ACFY3U_08645 [Micromonospora sp. NPDC000089]|uniref:hypothetical protein n=1 Tax=unclassified Micromonospora TaxID=2617518 RepID=UPI0036CC4A0B